MGDHDNPESSSAQQSVPTETATATTASQKSKTNKKRNKHNKTQHENASSASGTTATTNNGTKTTTTVTGVPSTKPTPLFPTVQSKSTGVERIDFGTNDTLTMLEPIPTAVVAEQLDTVLHVSSFVYAWRMHFP